HTADNQDVPAVAMDDSGNFIITWQSDKQDGDKRGIYGQQYDSGGVAQGGEFLVNTTTTNEQTNPAVAMSSSGKLVAVWDGNGPGDGTGIFGQRYTYSATGITVTPTSGLATTEAGGTATFTVVLTSQPTANVAIGVSSSNTAEGTVSPASLTFTAANWNVAQTVTVMGVDDFVDDGDIVYTVVTAAATSNDSNYSGWNAPDVSVTNTDNDTAGITVTP